MKRRSFIQHASLGAAAVSLASQTKANLAHLPGGAALPRTRPGGATPVKSILSFATEAAHAVEDYDFIKSIADFLTGEDLIGNFHLTGDYARALKRHGRLDVVESLQRHEIGYHCNHHGSKPFMAGYLEQYPWEEGLSRWLSNEAPGLAAVAELVNRRPVYYTTEFSKAPQAIYGSALLGAGLMGYSAVPTREHSAVWFCNSFIPTVENIVALESFHAPGADREKQARDRLDASVAKQQANKKDVLRVFLHSYKYYAEPPYDRLTMTREIYKNDAMYFEDYPTDYPRQSPEQFRKSFEMFKRTIRYQARQSEFVSFAQYRDEYQANTGVWIDLAEVDRLAGHLTESLDAYVADGYSISPAEAFGVMARLLRVWRETNRLPERVFVRNLIGPRAPVPESGPEVKVEARALRDLWPAIDREMEISGAMPVTCTVGGQRVGPGQLLRVMISLYGAIRQNRMPEVVPLAGGNLPEIAREEFFKETAFNRDGLYPPDFTGRQICALSRAQSWSWKPAVKRTA